ncbi:hypothetical protein SMICM304S_05486 [Streptomyces microflavus]
MASAEFHPLREAPGSSRPSTRTHSRRWSPSPRRSNRRPDGSVGDWLEGLVKVYSSKHRRPPLGGRGPARTPRPPPWSLCSTTRATGTSPWRRCAAAIEADPRLGGGRPRAGPAGDGRGAVRLSGWSPTATRSRRCWWAASAGPGGGGRDVLPGSPRPTPAHGRARAGRANTDLGLLGRRRPAGVDGSAADTSPTAPTETAPIRVAHAGRGPVPNGCEERSEQCPQSAGEINSTGGGSRSASERTAAQDRASSSAGAPEGFPDH